MSDLQLGLLAIGVAVVAGVIAYNRWQERSSGAAPKARSQDGTAMPCSAARGPPCPRRPHARRRPNRPRSIAPSSTRLWSTRHRRRRRATSRLPG